MTPTEDRRRTKRLSLRWVVKLTRPLDGRVVRCVTDNLSIEGFHCVCDLPFLPGERLDCVLELPAQRMGYSEADIHLECRVRVVRVEAFGSEPRFGIACQIEDYHPVVKPRFRT